MRIAIISFQSFILRSIFWFSVVVLTFLYCLLIPAILLPRWCVRSIVKSYIASLFFLLKHFLGVDWRVSGNVPDELSPVLVAAKHHSILETLVLQYVLHDPAIVLKKELLAVPLFGWTLWRLGHIGIDRSAGLEAAHKMCVAAIDAQRQGRTVVIFPEGSRQAIDQLPDYKSGVYLLYASLRCPCVPVAVNSGQILKPKSLSPVAGTAIIEFLPTIGPGLSRTNFLECLQSQIESATERLLQA